MRIPARRTDLTYHLGGGRGAGYKHPMRILMAARRYPPDVYSGTETVFQALYEQARQRHEVRLVVGWKRARECVPPEAVGVEIRGLGKVQQWLAIARAVRKEVHRWQPDVVLSNSIEVPPNRCPTVCIVHDLNFGMASGRPADGSPTPATRTMGAWGRKRFYGLRSRTLDRIVTVSQASADTLVAIGVKPDRIRVVHNGVDLERFRPRVPEREDDRVRFVYPSRILPGKGQHIAVDALARLPRLHKRRAELHIVGAVADPVYLDQVRVQAFEQPVSFHLDVPDIAPHIQDADAVVFPSVMAEGFGFTAVEAMACGKPVIWSDQPAIREATGGIGIPVGVEDVDALRAAMCTLIDEPETRASLGAAGRDHVESHRSWARVWERYEAVLGDVVR
jgi:glycosyltransferase involved in cell wall biosynthesis